MSNATLMFWDPTDIGTQMRKYKRLSRLSIFIELGAQSKCKKFRI